MANECHYEHAKWEQSALETWAIWGSSPGSGSVIGASPRRFRRGSGGHRRASRPGCSRSVSNVRFGYNPLKHVRDVAEHVLHANAPCRRATRLGRVRHIEVDEVLPTVSRDGLRHPLCQVAVRINEHHPPAAQEVLHCERLKERGLTRPTRSRISPGPTFEIRECRSASKQADRFSHMYVIGKTI
jgi:hypothetical protein